MSVLNWRIHHWLVTFLYRRYAVFPAAMAAKAVARPAMDSECWFIASIPIQLPILPQGLPPRNTL